MANSESNNLSDALSLLKMGKKGYDLIGSLGSLSSSSTSGIGLQAYGVPAADASQLGAVSSLGSLGSLAFGAGAGIIAGKLIDDIMTHGQPDPYIGLKDLTEYQLPLDASSGQKSSLYNYQVYSGDMDSRASTSLNESLLEFFDSSFSNMEPYLNSSVNDILSRVPEHMQVTSGLSSQPLDEGFNSVVTSTFDEMLHPLLLDIFPESAEGTVEVNRVVDRAQVYEELGPDGQRDTGLRDEFFTWVNDNYAPGQERINARSSQDAYLKFLNNTGKELATDSREGFVTDEYYRSLANPTDRDSNQAPPNTWVDVNKIYSPTASNLADEFSTEYLTELGNGNPFDGFTKLAKYREENPDVVDPGLIKEGLEKMDLDTTGDTMTTTSTTTTTTGQLEDLDSLVSSLMSIVNPGQEGLDQVQFKLGNQTISKTPKDQTDNLDLLLKYLATQDANRLKEKELDQHYDLTSKQIEIDRLRAESGAAKTQADIDAMEPSFIDKTSQLINTGADIIDFTKDVIDFSDSSFWSDIMSIWD